MVAVAVRDPYDVNQFPNVPTYVATYSYTPAALDSAGAGAVRRARPHRAAAR